MDSWSLIVASASLNLTGQEWHRNLSLIKRAIDQATEASADLLAFAELTLTGPDCGDYFQYHNNEIILSLLSELSAYAAAKNPKLLISVGHPWYYADKMISDGFEGCFRQQSPLYNRLSKPFIVQSFLQNSQILGMSVKSQLNDFYYESRNFNAWVHPLDTIFIDIPELSNHKDPRKISVPFGHPSVVLNIQSHPIRIAHLIGDELPDPQKLSPQIHQASILLNPISSIPNSRSKNHLHKTLSRLNQSQNSCILRTNHLGNSGGNFAYQGEISFIQRDHHQKLKVHKSSKTTFNDINFFCHHLELDPFQEKLKHRRSIFLADGLQRAPKKHQKNLSLPLHLDALWLFDYLRKSQLKTLVHIYINPLHALMNAGRIHLMIRLALEDLSPETFIARLNLDPELLKNKKTADEIQAALRRALLQTVYFIDKEKTKALNTERSARHLGGQLHVMDINPILEKIALVHSKVNLDALTQDQSIVLQKTLRPLLAMNQSISKEKTIALRQRFNQLKQELGLECSGPILTATDPADRIILKALKERLQAVMALTIANTIPASVAITDTDLDSLCLNQTVFGGKLHSGQLALLADRFKADLFEEAAQLLALDPHLASIFKQSLHASKRSEALAHRIRLIFKWILKGLDKNGFKHAILKVFKLCQQHEAFKTLSPSAIFDQIKCCYEGFAQSQTHIHASPLGPNNLGQAVNHEICRFPNISGAYQTELAELRLYCLGKQYFLQKDYLLVDSHLATALLKHRNLKRCQAWLDTAAIDKKYFASNTIIRQAMQFKSPKPQKFPLQSTQTACQLKISSASCNQTAFDWPRNIRNICAAVDQAASDGAAILCLQELALSGYHCDDYFLNIENELIQRALNLIARYAAVSAPQMVISIGHPWRIHLKNQAHRSAPIKPFNVQSLLYQGEIIAMSAKSYLFNDERGYESRYFQEWRGDESTGRQSIMMDLPGLNFSFEKKIIKVPAKTIPFGAPVISLNINGQLINLFHVICEEAWIGSPHDHQNPESYDQDNPLAIKSKMIPISIAINPNASPPTADKITIYQNLARQASQYCDLFVHTNYIGTESSAMTGFGTQIFASQGEIILEAIPLKTHNVNYLSQVCLIPFIKNTAFSGDLIIPYPDLSLRAKEKNKAKPPNAQDSTHPKTQQWALRSELLWLFDMMRKSGIHGLVQALSGGQDSAYNASKIRLMTELVIKEQGLLAYLSALSFPKAVQRQIIKTWPVPIFAKEDKIDLKNPKIQASIDLIISKTLFTYYLSTANNSAETFKAAQTFIKGGSISDFSGKKIKFSGLGGAFEKINIQGLVDEFLLRLYPIDSKSLRPEAYEDLLKALRFFAKLRRDDLLAIYHDLLKEEPDFIPSTWPKPLQNLSEAEWSVAKDTEEERIRAAILKKFQSQISTILNIKYQDKILTPLNRNNDGITIENIQARTRQIMIWLQTDHLNHNQSGLSYQLIANPNQSEARHGYTTFGGDLHSGRWCLNIHKEKAEQRQDMIELYQSGLDTIPAMQNFHDILYENPPSAELQGLSYGKKPQLIQTDEASMGSTYLEMLHISKHMIQESATLEPQRWQSPIEVFERAQAEAIFNTLSKAALHDKLIKSYLDWQLAQHKIHATPLGLSFGKNIDHKLSLQTPCLNAFHGPELAQLTLYCLDQLAKEESISFTCLSQGRSLMFCLKHALIDASFAKSLSHALWSDENIKHLGTDRKQNLSDLYQRLKKKDPLALKIFSSLPKSEP